MIERGKNYDERGRMTNLLEGLSIFWIHSLTHGFTSISPSQHPHIYPVELVGYHAGCGAIIRKWNSPGSLKDAIYRCKPKNQFFRKYYSGKGKPLDETKIRKYGREILEVRSEERKRRS